jgi:hypothetical protein
MPPYARRTAHHESKDARVIVGAAGWELVRQYDRCGWPPPRLFAVLPDGEGPELFDWGAFSGREVKVSWYRGTDASVPHRLALELIAAGAELVLSQCHDGPRGMTLYRQGAGEVAE